MKTLLFTILLTVPALAQNRSWQEAQQGIDERRPEREQYRRLNEMQRDITAAKVEIAGLKSSLAYTDKLLWAAIGGGALGTGLGANAHRKRKQV